ncbi:MAG: cobalt-precorrin-5B (C(1))-methyltransferase CbiD [Treponema sp.]|nr:cobalt-precorrin-5B (C(1))-methyltransferase CbiD [Treponema sp.]
MRFGFTTGSCAAAGAKAACYMLLTGKEKREIVIKTPKGLDFRAEILDINRSENQVSCAVVKDGGDDPDITTGAHIVSTVRFLKDEKSHIANENTSTDESDGKNKNRNKNAFVVIKGGKGVGKVTKPGLDQKVGNAAINHVPREMIEKEVLEVCALCDYSGGIEVEVSVPEGENLAEKTFNPRLGIVGGISILGTSGVVEPMSAQALKDTIFVELRQNRALARSAVSVSPGNYGLDFMKKTFDFDIDKSVKCSNFIGDTLDMARGLGFKKILLMGHIGKLIKISGGIMNTHSCEGDCRMELLCAAALKAGCSLETAKAILDAVSTEEGIAIIKNADFRKSQKPAESKEFEELENAEKICKDSEKSLLERTMDFVMERIMFFLRKRAGENLEVGCIVFCNEFGLLGKSENAISLLEECKSQI